MDILKAVNELYGDCLQDGNQIYVGTSPITTEQLAEATAKAEADYEVYQLEKLVKDIEQAVQDTLDTKAKEYRYDNMLSARSYAGYVNPFQEEATKLAVWASNCWVKVGEIEALGEVVTVEYVLEQLPKYEVIEEVIEELVL